MRMKKVKVFSMISSELHDLMIADYEKYGVSKSYIINSALVEYYARRAENKEPSVNG